MNLIMIFQNIERISLYNFI